MNNGSRDILVDVATRYGPDDPGFESRQGKRFFFFQKCPGNWVHCRG
jgi:hypothetical protein